MSVSTIAFVTTFTMACLALAANVWQWTVKAKGGRLTEAQFAVVMLSFSAVAVIGLVAIGTATA